MGGAAGRTAASVPNGTEGYVRTGQNVGGCTVRGVGTVQCRGGGQPDDLHAMATEEQKKGRRLVYATTERGRARHCAVFAATESTGWQTVGKYPRFGAGIILLIGPHRQGS